MFDLPRKLICFHYMLRGVKKYVVWKFFGRKDMFFLLFGV